MAIKRMKLTPTELLFYCVWLSSNETDYPKRNKPSENEIMELLQRKGSTATFKNQVNEIQGCLVSDLALQIIRLLLKAGEKQG